MACSPDQDALTEHLLVLRAQLGARDAYARLFARHDAHLRFYLRRFVGTAADAEDLSQEVWLTVVRKLRTLEQPGAFRAWLYRVARHHAISWLRRRRPEVTLDEAAPGGETDASMAPEVDELFRVEDAAALHAALDLLSPSHREMLSLRFLGELTYEEIARVLDCPVGTVRSRVHYAKAALRGAMSGSAPRSAETTRKGATP